MKPTLRMGVKTGIISISEVAVYFDELVDAYEASRRERNVFHDLMRWRVREVLLVGSLYDSFVVESDGILNEQVYGEYYKLNLNTVPRISSAYTEETALELFGSRGFDLAILMAGLDFERPLAIASAMKEARPSVPVLLLVTNNSSLERLDLSRPELAAIDKVFVWNGYSKLFVGMLKYIEDARNAQADTRTGLIRVVLLIEDSVRYYSRYLPLLYQVAMRQTQSLIEGEKGGETYKLLRARARPKVLLASSWEEAYSLFELYEPYILTVITDLSFPRKGKPDALAGLDFLRMAKGRIKDLPVMIQSSEGGSREKAAEFGAAYADKNSESLERELGDYLRDSLGFGPFRFRSPDGAPLTQAATMDEFIAALADLPLDSLLYHAQRNHFSAWLLARGEIEFAKVLRDYEIADFATASEIRGFLIRVLVDARKDSSRGTIPNFDEAAFRDEDSLTRLGDGSVGGKGRGILFIRNLLDNLDFARYLGEFDVKVPRTSFVGIDEFERFLESNGLWSYAYYDAQSELELRERFLASPLDADFVRRLERYVAAVKGPLAVRSSGLFEDMLMVPFSGVYDTYIIPNCHPDSAKRLGQLTAAIKLIYASLFSVTSRSYFELAKYNLEEERMAVVIQELVGSRRGRWFYPHVSGTAQSFNYYPLSYAKPEDGLCVAALGLGSYVVEGLPSYRFCPRYPKLEAMPPAKLRSDSQRHFRALDMETAEPDLRRGEDGDLVDLELSVAESDPAFSLLASTWDAQNDRLVPGIAPKGMRVVDLSSILQFDALPFARAIDMVLDVGSRSMGTPVEIEYALNLDEASGKAALYLLQLKPLIRAEQGQSFEFDCADPEEAFILSEKSMGNGRDGTICDIVWVDLTRFDRSVTEVAAREIEELDHELRALGRQYVLIGPGRWGTRDRWLGIPAVYSQIANARIIVETEMPGFPVDFSFGSHFFHNVTSMNIGFLTVPGEGQNFVDWHWLSSFPPERRTAHCARTRLAEPLEIVMDGRKGRAIVRKRAASE
ncbi:MAG: PEP/pyruvate-binding domain-containing protein [Rectinemataceae bacterium]